jgi:hypothetical protein
VSLLLIVAAVGLASCAMLVVRTKAPAGGFFTNSGVGGGVFGVLGTVVALTPLARRPLPPPICFVLRRC